MKKMILLLALPLTVLMAIDFTMTPKGLFAEETTQSPAPGTDTKEPSSYLEPVNIPAYDSGNSEHFLISSDADWSHINDSDKKHFYVEPGDYSSLGVIEITRSGTAISRRTISLHNGNNTHPGKLTKNYNNLAMYSLELDGASYWTIDRPSWFDKTISGGNIYQLTNGSQYNVFNRIFTNNVQRTFRVINASHNNTIQNSRLDTMREGSRKGDITAIEIVPFPYNGSGYALKRTKIINNEIVNANDGIQMVSYWYKEGTPLNGEGTIIDNNDIYFTNAVYTDGNGNADTNGDYMFAENSMDFKFGSLNPSNPAIVSNNRMWGARKADSTGSSISATGALVTTHFGSFNLHFKNNILFDANNGLSFGGNQGHDHAYDGEVTGNILQDVGTISGIEGYAIKCVNSKDTLIEDNIISKSRNNYMRVGTTYGNMTVRRNISLDTPMDWDIYSNGGSANSFAYHAVNENAGSYQAVTAVSLGYTDYTFTTDKFTNSPREITLKNVVSPN